MIYSVERSGAGGIFEYVSPSRLNLWLRCPRAFKYRYIDGIRPPPTTSLFLGQRVHAALEHYYRHRQLGITLPTDLVLHQLRNTWEWAADSAGIVLPRDANGAVLQQACELVGLYLRTIPMEPRPLAVECRLELPLIEPETSENLGMPLVGVLDLVLPTTTGPVICDFKTSARSSPPLELVHEIQLGCYAYLFRQISASSEGELQIRNLIKTKSPKVETHRYSARTEVQLTRLFAVIREYLDAIHHGRFDYRPAWTCSTCEFRQRCAGHGN